MLTPALGECLGTLHVRGSGVLNYPLLHDTAYRMAYKKTKLGGRVRHDACGGGQNIGRCGYSNGGLGFPCGFSKTLQRVLCTVANRSLTLRAILSLPPHSEFAVLEGPLGP